MKLPAPRGAASHDLFDHLRDPEDAARARSAVVGRLVRTDDILADDDLQIALFALYELHHGGFDDVSDDLEWDPELLRIRGLIETDFEAAVRMATPTPALPDPSSEAVARALFDLTAPAAGPSVSRFIAKRAGDDQLREFVIQKSIYQLREADPHTWAIPRLRGRSKAALIEIQTDEYGSGREEFMHCEIFAQTMRSMGLDPEYGAYIESITAPVLASLNLMSLFGLHRRLRGAIVGHLAAYEMTSSIPCRLYGDGFRRLGYGEETTWYFDEHVEADAVHEQIAGRDLAGGLAEAEPLLTADIMFGASACLAIEGLAGARMLEAWEAGASALRPGALAHA
jgi:hypothetical protein